MNRETFLTLNKTRLFTADQVVDIVQSERDTCPQNKIWQHCPVAEQIRKQERDKVLGDEHYRNALSLCDNLLVHLEDNDITYLQIKKTVALVKKELQKFRQAGEQ